MSKSDKMTTKMSVSVGILSVSKSQKTASRRAAQKKLQPIVQRGGCCPACGQSSTSCASGTEHVGCERQNKLEFRQHVYPALFTMATRVNLFADGSPRSAGVPSIWLPLTAFADLRAAREEEAKRILSREVHIIITAFCGPLYQSKRSIKRGDKEPARPLVVYYADGNGTPVYWNNAEKRYTYTIPAPEAYEDPSLADKVSIEETGHDVEDPIEIGVPTFAEVQDLQTAVDALFSNNARDEVLVEDTFEREAA